MATVRMGWRSEKSKWKDRMDGNGLPLLDEEGGPDETDTRRSRDLRIETRNNRTSHSREGKGPA